MSHPFRLAFVFVALAGVAAAGCDIEARFDNVNGEFERTLQVSGPVDLTVTTGSGNIRVVPGPDGAIKVVGHIRAHDSIMSGLSAEERVERIEGAPPISQAGNVVRVGEFSDSALRHNVSIDFEITAPPSTAVHSRTGSGDQVIDSVQGPVEVSAGSGNLHVSSIAGAVSATTGSGDIRLRRLGGNAQARAGSGDVEVVEIGGGLRIRTGSGDIAVDGSPQNDWTIDAASGDVSIRVPQTARFTVDASSRSGGISTTHHIEETGGSRRELRGLVGGGGPRIEVSTASGSIEID